MFAVEVRDHIMIAHSFVGEMFGPAQAMHGATFVIDMTVFSKDLDENNVVVDIGAAHEVLKSVLAPLNYVNLDEVPKFKGINTTTEFLCRYIWDEVAQLVLDDGLGRSGKALTSLKITLSESHVARAWYEAPLHG